jgi:tetratricopeptide (TPR) repeat protein
MLRSKTATQLVLVLSLFAGAACTEAADAKPASGTGSHGTPQQCTSALEAVEALVPEDDALLAAALASPKDAAAHVALASAVLAIGPAAGNAEEGAPEMSTSTDAAVELLWYALAINKNETLDGEAKNLLLDAAESWTGGPAAAETDSQNKAAALYSKLVELTPDDPTPLFGLTTLYQRNQMAKEAAATLRQALLLAPDDQPAQMSLALMLSGLGAHKESREHAAIALKLSTEALGQAEAPQDRERLKREVSEAYVVLGLSAVQADDIEGATAHLRAAAKADPSNENAATKLAALEGALAKQAAGLAAAAEAKADAADAAEDTVMSTGSPAGAGAAEEEGADDASAYELDAEDEGVAM